MIQEKFKVLREAAKVANQGDAPATLLAEAAFDVLEFGLTDLHRIADALERIADNTQG